MELIFENSRRLTNKFLNIGRNNKYSSVLPAKKSIQQLHSKTNRSILHLQLIMNWKAKREEYLERYLGIGRKK